MTFKQWLSRRRKRTCVKVRRLWKNNQKFLSGDVKLTDSQLLVISIVKKAIIYPGSELLFTPKTGTKYIHFNDMYIKIDNELVTIINGNSSYQVHLNEKALAHLVYKFNLKLESTTGKWEDKIETQTQNSLSSILTQLTITDNKQYSIQTK